MPSFTFVSTRQRVRAARREAGLRRHPPGHAEPRRAAGRGGDHAAHEGHRARPLRGRRLRAWTPSASSPAHTGFAIVEDAAQGLLRDLPRPARSARSGDLGALSFHETKNVTCGEGGALLINDDALAERAEILREKGTNRSRFFRGEVDKYTWVDLGSSYVLERARRRVPVGAARGRPTDHRACGGDLGRYHAAFADAGERPARPPPDRAGRLRAQRAHVLPAAAGPRAAHARRSPRCASAASTPSSTTCRCIPRRPGAASGATVGELPVTDVARRPSAPAPALGRPWPGRGPRARHRRRCWRLHPLCWASAVAGRRAASLTGTPSP